MLVFRTPRPAAAAPIAEGGSMRTRIAGLITGAFAVAALVGHAGAQTPAAASTPPAVQAVPATSAQPATPAPAAAQPAPAAAGAGQDTAPAATGGAAPAPSLLGGGASGVAGVMKLEPGLYRCELSRRVVVRRIENDGQTMVINWQGKDHTLNAVAARTGALRFENSQEGLMWLVIVGKSMLLDMRRGQQLANECTL
jgi:hypothetical protein